MGRSGHLAPVASLRRTRPVAREHLPRQAASVGAARLLVDDVLTRHEVDRSLVETAVLLASELATDGVRHGSGAQLLVEVALGVDVVMVTVSADSARRAGQPAAPIAEHSQQVLDIMAAAWEVRTGGGTRTGWCRVERGAASPDPGPGRGGDPSGAHRPTTAAGRPVLRRIK